VLGIEWRFKSVEITITMIVNNYTRDLVVHNSSGGSSGPIRPWPPSFLAIEFLLVRWKISLERS